MIFEFATAGRIIFGPGMLKQIGPLAAGFGRRALVIVNSTVERAQPLIDLLNAAGVGAGVFQVQGEPTVQRVLSGVQVARSGNCDLIIGLGGGSAMDSAKAIAALLTNPGDPLDYLEVVGRGQALQVAPAPWIAIPTTAGTGAEVTRNAVLGVPEQQVKVSLRSPLMLPRIALIDPELTYSLPPDLTASTGMDALTQCLEPFVSPAATPFTDGFCREGMRRAARGLRRAFQAGGDAAAREDMAITARQY